MIIFKRNSLYTRLFLLFTAVSVLLIVLSIVNNYYIERTIDNLERKNLDLKFNSIIFFTDTFKNDLKDKDKREILLNKFYPYINGSEGKIVFFSKNEFLMINFYFI